jgi:lipopolysaccharide transport system ATP-binding protein
MSEIQLKAVGKRYRRTTTGVRKLRKFTEWGPRVEQWALREVSFSVEPGETLGIVGRNGSGKSTLLRVVAGITRPTCGSVMVTRRISGLLTLGEAFHPLLSAEENALTQSILAGVTRRQALARLSDIASFAELEDHMDQPLRTFSDGMRLRLGFAVAISVDPNIMLIDEILAVGDLRFQQKCYERLAHLQESGVTIVVASHEMRQIRMVCRRALWLSDGRVHDIGDASDVVERYENAMTEGVPRRNPVGLGKERLGSGEVEITQVRLLDAFGREASSIPPAEAIRVEIDYLAHQTIPDAIFGVSAHSQQDDVLHLDVSTAGDGYVVGELQGEGTVTLHLEQLDLASGSYWLDVGVHDTERYRPYDYLWEVLPFQVGSSDRREEPHPPRSWSIR